MGTKMAPSYANIFIHYLEDRIITSLNLKPTLWYRYIDYIFIIWPHGEDELGNLVIIINHFHPTIKCTQSADYSKIPFLDTLVCRDTNNKIYTKLYQKPTDNRNYPHFHSAHPKKYKESVPYGLLMRCRRICIRMEDFKEENHKTVTKLMERRYPKTLLDIAVAKVTAMKRTDLLKPSIRKPLEKIRHHFL